MPNPTFCFASSDPPRLVSVRGGTEALLGYSQHELLTAKVNLKDLIHPEDAGIAESIFSNCLEIRSGCINVRLRHADGRIRCVKGSFTKKPSRTGDNVILELALEDARNVAEPGDAFLLRSFKSLIEHTNDHIYVKNRNHVILSASRAVPSLTETTKVPSELVGKTDYDIYPEAIADLSYQLENQAISENQRVNQVQQLTAQDGSDRWIDDRKYPITGPNGEVAGIFGIAPDITPQIEGRLKLRESQDLLQLFIEHAPVALAMLDREMRYQAVSRKWLEIHDLNGRDLIGRSHYEIFPNLPEGFGQMHRTALSGEVVTLSEIALPRADGSKQWLRREIRPWFAGDGEVGGIIIFSEDITDRKRADTALRDSEESLREAQRIAGLGSYLLDIDTRRWTSSDVMDQIFGIDKEYEHTVEGWADMIHPDERSSMLAYFKDGVLGQCKPFDREYRVIRKNDGAVRWVHGIGRLELDAQGRPVKMPGTIQDITEAKQAQEALRESQHLLQLFIENAPVALAMFDREMRYISVSRKWLEDYGLVGREVIGRSHYEFVPDMPERWKEGHRRGLAGERVHVDEDRFDRADGTVEWSRWEVIPWRTGDGSVGGIVLFAENITERKAVEDRLRMGATVFTGAREGITITDRSGTILEVNDAFSRITGYSRKEVLGLNPRVLQSGLHSGEFYDNMWSSLNREGHWSGEIWNRTKSGDIYAEMLTINAIHNAKGDVEQYVGMFTDITELKEQEQRLEHISRYDALTGLPNRTLLGDRLRQAMVHAHWKKGILAVACFDVDGFKAINDRYGHATGDGLLTALAFRMKRALREGDMLARLGGDEFAAVILDLDDTNACLATLNRLLAAAGEEAQIGEAMLRVSASAGVTFYPQNEDVDADVLLRQAGQAMYQAKLAGRNCFRMFDPNQDQIVRGRLENIEHIRQALAAHQFVLYYQPKVNMRTGKVIGAEALIRWQHPERGLLPPGMFLPVIEDHPLAVQLGEWVIETALTQMESWLAEGFELPVSVNVSAIELQQADFADRVRAHLAAHPQVKPADLELEVVETNAVQDVMRTSQVLKACREIGVAIGLDDFGTGYSSLTYLKRLPANVLKIDQSFVRDMLEEPENLTILEGVLGLASAFHRTVIAEGVETAEHGLMLLQMGCDLAQGFGIAASMPARELRAWAATWRPDPRWADVPVVRAENRPVLLATVEHRAWLGALEASLQGKRAVPPPLDASVCRVGMWLEDEKRLSHGTDSAVRAIESLHRQIHELAAEIVASQADGPNPEGLAGLRQLHYLQDKCLKRMKTFA
jgi:diguanylate cyclase (GGDEF)-like protein/PAS domain S-box-containing protein